MPELACLGPTRPRNDASRAAARPAVVVRSCAMHPPAGRWLPVARWPPVAHWLPAAPGFWAVPRSRPPPPQWASTPAQCHSERKSVRRPGCPGRSSRTSQAVLRTTHQRCSGCRPGRWRSLPAPMAINLIVHRACKTGADDRDAHFYKTAGRGGSQTRDMAQARAISHTPAHPRQRPAPAACQASPI